MFLGLCLFAFAFSPHTICQPVNPVNAVATYDSSAMLSDLDIVEVYVGLELCEKGVVDFCGIGFDDILRLGRVFVELDLSTFIGSYYRPVYVVEFTLWHSQARKAGLEVPLPYVIDRLIDSVSESTSGENIVKFDVPETYNEKVEQVIERNGLSTRNRGYFSYALFRVKMSVVRLDARVLWIPAIWSDDVITGIRTEVYGVVSILSLQPVAVEEYVSPGVD